MQQISLAEAIKQRRLELGLSQEQVCEGICEPPTLSRLENGKQTMTHNRIKALMQRLNMPDDRYYALLSKRETELDNTRRELAACSSQYSCAKSEEKKVMWQLAMKQLHRLELLAEEDDAITQQCILSYKSLLGQEDRPYSLEKQLEMLFAALRLTVPNFQLDKFASHRYSADETRIINLIAGAYSENGDHATALELFKQLFEYVGKHDDQLSIYAPHYTMVTYNFSRELCFLSYYHEAIDIAEQGRRISIKYGYYQFLLGLLAIIGESYYYLGATEKSKKFCVQAHYLYEILGNDYALSVIDPDIQKRFNIDFSA